MNLTDISLKNPVFAWMLMAGAMLFGIVAASRIGVSQYPDVDYPNISVSVSWSGASPSAVEREVLEPLEQAIAQVEGVQTVTAQARQGSARLTVQLDLSRDVDLALQDVQAKVAQATRSLPKDVPAATVSKSNPDDTPILQVAVSGPFSRQLLADVARYTVQQQLQTVPGVGQITMSGYLDRNVRVWLDGSRMAEKGVAVTDVLGSLQREHVEVPGGSLEVGGRTLSIRMLGEALDIETFKHIVVRRVGNTPIYLKDVAEVEDGFEDATSISRLDGVPLQSLGILKQRGTNAVSVATNLREKVAEIQKTLPAGMKVEVLFDSTKFIEEAVHEVEVELFAAVILTAIVCWLFLGSLSSTLNVVLAIPMSLLGTIAVIYFVGFTLNTFTLLGLSLAVGLVVDDAVMVMENIYRHAEMGKDKKKAAGDGTKEITFAALAASVAVIAIFLPVVFMRGVIGKFFYQFGITLSVAVAFSYFEAITLAPARCAQMLVVTHVRGKVGQWIENRWKALDRLYTRTLERALRHPIKVLLASLVILAGSVVVGTRLPAELVPTQDQSRLTVRLTTESGASLLAATPLLERAEGIVRAHPEVSRMLVSMSGTGGSMTLDLVPPKERSMSAQVFAVQLRKELGVIAGLRASVQDPSQQSFGGGKASPIDFTVRGADWDELVTTAMKLRDELVATGIAVDVNTDYNIGTPELDLIPDRRRASELGVSMSDLGTAVSSLVGGNVVTKFATAGRRVDVRARLLAGQRARPEDLSLLRVRSKSGDLVPLSMLVTQVEKPVLQSINRVDRERAINITGNVAVGHSQSEVLKKVDELAKDLPIGYRVVKGGQSTQLTDTMSDLGFALILGILVAYMVLASQFGSFLHPVTVLTILPLALSGASFALGAAGKSLNMFSMIGVLLLMGLAKKNSILLVEYANHVREHEGVKDALGAMMRAGPLRLRPILMTTLATMMGAVPSALGLGPGAETRAPMALAVLGGLALSTFLCLFVVPAFYVVTDRWKTRLLGSKTPELEAPLHVPGVG